MDDRVADVSAFVTANQKEFNLDVVNTTRIQTECILASDQNGVEHYLIVAKGTFDIHLDRRDVTLSKEQLPLVYADQFYGDPGSSSIKEAYDFAFRKPKTDLVVVGSACSREAVPVRELEVRLIVGNRINKAIRVVGDRIWKKRFIGGFYPSEPELWQTMPLIYERAFGGSDMTHRNPKRHRFHRENLVGMGVHSNRIRKVIAGARLANLEHPEQPIRRLRARTTTIGFSFVSPNWLSRLRHAGTYDQEWLEKRYPLLPMDFDERFYQSAPEDQILDTAIAGEEIRLDNMHPAGTIALKIPDVSLPIVLMFKDRDLAADPKLDTIVIRPNELKLNLVWRAVIRRVGKPYSLRKIVVGKKTERWFARQRSSKLYYKNLQQLIAAKQKS